MPPDTNDIARNSIFRNAPDEPSSDIVERASVFRAQTVDEKARTVEVVLATETAIQCLDRASWSPCMQILRMDGMVAPATNQVPILDGHSSSNVTNGVRGSLRNLKVEGGNLIARAHFAEDAESDRVWSLYRGGHLTDFSIGARIIERTIIAAGQTATVNGRSYTAGEIPTHVITKWKPMHGAAVPVGADELATTRSAETGDTTKPQGKPMKKFHKWLEALGVERSALSDAQLTAFRSTYKAETGLDADDVERQAEPITPKTTVSEEDGSEISRASGIKIERKRVADIRSESEGLPADLVNRAIDDGWDIARARAEFLAHLRANRGDNGTEKHESKQMPTVEVTRAAQDKLTLAFEDSVAIARGDQLMDTVRGGQVISAAQRRADARDLAGAGPQDLARAALVSAGQNIPINPEQLLERAVSTYAFPTALGNTLNRSLSAGFDAVQSTAMLWAGRLPVKDFREHKNISIGKFGRPEKVGKGGLVPHTEGKEEAEGYSADTYAQQFVFTRQDFINDDLTMFTRTPVMLGESMKMNIDDVFYDLLISASGVGPTLDSASHGDAAAKALFATDRSDGANYITGTGSALATAGLTAAKTLMRKIKNNGRNINVMPYYLVVPAALEQTALGLVNSSLLITGADTTTTDGNTHRGSLQVIVEPRLDAATNGGTAWYLVARAVAEHMALSFLRGQESPTVEKLNLTSPLAMGWLAYHDVGASAVGWRGIQRNKGAA